MSDSTRRAAIGGHITEDMGYETPCWMWPYAKTDEGYGLVFVSRVLRSAHRAYYEQHVGPIPAGLTLDHLCRNRACVNPAHMEPVTIAENVRRGKGTKLTHADVAEIRSRLAEGEKHVKIARDYGVSSDAISDIARGRKWVAV